MEDNNNYIRKIFESGLSLIPIAEGKKSPHYILGQEHHLLEVRATEEELNEWIAAKVTSWAIAGGSVSKNLMALDFDEKHYLELFDKWYARLAKDQKALVDKAFIIKTRNGGKHVRYLTETPQPSIKIARRVVWNESLGHDTVVTTAETKGEGGYALIPPSAGYEVLQGSILDLPIIPDEIHEELVDVLRTFNEVKEIPKTEYERKITDSSMEDLPGNRLNQNMSWNEILEPHAWAEDKKNYWRRPGKKPGEGISATTDYDGIPMLYIFSTSAYPFNENTGYSKFHAFALLNHKGDFKEAAKNAALLYPRTNLIGIAEAMLSKIPSDIEKVQLVEALNPILKTLTGVDKITAENFILYNVKAHFKITKEDAKKYLTLLKGIKTEKVKAEREQKLEKEKRPLILDRDIDFQEAYDAISEIGIIDKETLYIITAVIISSKLRTNPPLWLFLIGVPSSFKTELLGLFGDMEILYTLDTLTENAFASGYVPPDGSEPQDLLPRLDNKCFGIKDLNTLFSMAEEMVKKVLGDLTSIFDGKFEKFTATRGMVSYNSLFSMIGCVTPSILNKHYNYATMLGPRFFFYRLPELSESEMAISFEKSWNENDRKQKIINTRQVVSSYATQLANKIADYKPKPVPEKMRSKVNKIATFICKARGIAITGKDTFKNESGEDVTYYHIKDWQVEQPWRVLNQLKSLLSILAFMNGKETFDDEEIQIIKPMILSTMPVDRAEILKVLSEKCSLSLKEISREVKKSAKTIGRTMKELEALGITDAFKDPQRNLAGQGPWLHFITNDFAEIIGAPMPSEEFVSLSKANNDDLKSNSDDEDE